MCHEWAEVRKQARLVVPAANRVFQKQKRSDTALSALGRRELCLIWSVSGTEPGQTGGLEASERQHMQADLTVKVHPQPGTEALLSFHAVCGFPGSAEKTDDICHA